MKVLHVNAGNLYGGIETLLVTLARERRVCPEMEPEFALCFEGRLAEELRREGVPVHLLGPVRARYPWTVIRARRALSAVLAERRPGAVVTHGSWPHALAAPVVRAYRARLAYWAHAPAPPRSWLETLARRTPPDALIANSRFTASKTLFPEIPSRVIFYPVSAPHMARPRAVVRRELATPDGVTVVLAASRLERWKGVHTFVESLEGLPGDWIAWIAGGAQRSEERAYRDELVALAHARGLAERIRFLGQRTDVPDLMAAADIFCQANTGPEPFGLVFVEALAAQLPVVATAHGGVPEIVDETCGRLVAPTRVALREALGLLVGDSALRKRLGAAGPVRARDLCSPEPRLRELHALIGAT